MKNAMVTVKTVSVTDGEKEEYELTGEGTFFNSKGIVIIKYTDEMLDEEAGKIETSIKIEADNTVTVSRTGKYESRIEIISNKRTSCAYMTPYGTMMMGFYGKKIETDFNKYGGRLFASYTVDISNSLVNENEITVSVKEV